MLQGTDRPSAFQAGLAAVARSDVHIERVWPMRSPSTATREELSSASFPAGIQGSPPAGVTPVEGLHMNQSVFHVPVMVTEVVELLAPVPPGAVVDATVGGGGHSAAILQANPHLTVVGIDRDPSALEEAASVLAPFGNRAELLRGRFDEIDRLIAGRSGPRPGPATGPAGGALSAVLFDLGVSSHQLDVPERGFSYRVDAPLDMRMDPQSGVTAAQLVNRLDELALAELFADNGEPRFARRIARAVVAARPILTTGQLTDVVRAALPAAVRRTGGHPGRHVFQALRIAVNEELDQLVVAIGEALSLLAPGGRCVVIAYHSGEDRLVKSLFAHAASGGCTCPPGLPCVCGAAPEHRLVFRGTRRPSTAEVARNHRAEAARLRCIERIPGSHIEPSAIPDGGR